MNFCPSTLPSPRLMYCRLAPEVPGGSFVLHVYQHLAANHWEAQHRGRAIQVC